MGDSSLNATEIAVGSLLAGGGNRGGVGGGGAWGGGYGGVGPYASPSSNAVRIEKNSEIGRLGLDALQSLNINDKFATVAKDAFAAELRESNKISALQAEMNANARAAAECCCDIKLEACKNTASLTAEIKAVESRTVARELDRAEREIIFLKTTCAS